MGDEPSYILRESHADAESVRLALLEDWLDPDTFRRLDRLGVAPGARVLDVGAGRGSVARWLSDRVGPDGQVVAADIDCRFLTDLPDNVEVRRLDILEEDLEPDTYDVVHCRALLVHLPDPAGALRRMARALRPGGVLLAEEPDYGLFTYGGHPDAQAATAQHHRQFAQLAAANILGAVSGRELPGLIIEAGLEVVGGEAGASVARAGEAAFEWQRATMEAIAPSCIAAGFLTEDEHATVMRIMLSPSAVITSLAMVGVSGRPTS